MAPVSVWIMPASCSESSNVFINRMSSMAPVSALLSFNGSSYDTEAMCGPKQRSTKGLPSSSHSPTAFQRKGKRYPTHFACDCTGFMVIYGKPEVTFQPNLCPLPQTQ